MSIFQTRKFVCCWCFRWPENKMWHFLFVARIDCDNSVGRLDRVVTQGREEYLSTRIIFANTLPLKPSHAKRSIKFKNNSSFLPWIFLVCLLFMPSVCSLCCRNRKKAVKVSDLNGIHRSTTAAVDLLKLRENWNRTLRSGAAKIVIKQDWSKTGWIQNNGQRFADFFWNFCVFKFP